MPYEYPDALTKLVAVAVADADADIETETSMIPPPETEDSGASDIAPKPSILAYLLNQQDCTGGKKC